MTKAERDGETGKLIHFQRGARPMSFPAIAAIDAYWEALRGPRAMPRRDELDPTRLDAALPHAFLLERIAPGVARFRLAGMHLNELMGMEVRGMPLTAFIAPGSRRQVSDTLEEVFETPATCTLSLHSEKAPGMPALEARMILMPAILVWDIRNSFLCTL